MNFHKTVDSENNAHIEQNWTKQIVGNQFSQFIYHLNFSTKHKTANFYFLLYLK